MFVCDEADIRHTTHLTVDRGGGVKSNEIENYGYEGAQARNKVDLPNGTFNSSLQVDDGRREQRLSLPTHIVHR